FISSNPPHHHLSIHYPPSLRYFYSFFASLLSKLHFPTLPSLKFPFSHHFLSQKCHFLCATPNLTSMRCNTSSHMIELIQFRSEEHTSELQSRFDLVCRLLLEKKNKKQLKKIDIASK